MGTLDWLVFNRAVLVSAALFYGFVLACLWPGVRHRAVQWLAMPRPATQPQVAVLESARGLAALLVTLAHIWVFTRPLMDATQQQGWLGLAVAGNKAVPIFVVLSGLLIYRACRALASLDDLRRYALRRFWRVYPVYLLSVLCLHALGQAPAQPGVLWTDVLMVRVLTQGALPLGNPVAWSVYVEVLMYALMPLWVLVCRRHALVLALLTVALLMQVDPLGSRELWLWKYFFAGVIASECADRLGPRLGGAGHALLAAAGAALLVLDFQVTPAGTAAHDWAHAWGLVQKNLAEYTIGLGLGTVLLLVGVLGCAPLARALSVPPLRMLGAISYSLFMMHPVFLVLAFPALQLQQVPQLQSGFDPALRAPVWYAPALVLPGVLAWAAVVFVLIERPLMALRPR